MGAKRYTFPSIRCAAPRVPVTVIPFFSPHPLPTELYPLSLHDALPICAETRRPERQAVPAGGRLGGRRHDRQQHARLQADRKSTRLNSSHVRISYAVFCLKKKKSYNSPGANCLVRSSVTYSLSISFLNR